jgi:cytochrome b involved in lipid metabolism
MKNSKIIIGIIVLVVFAIGSFVALTRKSPVDDSASSIPENTNKVVANVPVDGTVKSYTMADVSKHNNQNDCWTAVNDKVYEVTKWISEHPGGAKAIISMCGIDGSAPFNDQHGGEKRPANELAGFLIGDLIK